MELYFSAKGRISRSQYWLGYLGITIVYTIGAYLIADNITSNYTNPYYLDNTLAQYDLSTQINNAQSALFLILLYPIVVINIKRLHDVNATGWLSIFGAFIVPAVIIGAIPGTQGSNRFGEDPLEA
jgi:uncharacterized membrane protein YhaH (DUF805 family)